MSGFQLDTLNSTPALDLVPPPPRVESRSEDSFQEHLRRSDGPSSAKPGRAEEPRSTPSDNRSTQSSDDSSPSNSLPEAAERPAAQGSGPESSPGPKPVKDDKPKSEEPCDSEEVASIVADVKTTLALPKEAKSVKAKSAEALAAAQSVDGVAKGAQLTIAAKAAARSAADNGGNATGAKGEQSETPIESLATTETAKESPTPTNATVDGARHRVSIEKAKADDSAKSLDSTTKSSRAVTDVSDQAVVSPVDKVEQFKPENPHEQGPRHHDKGHDDAPGVVDHADVTTADVVPTTVTTTPQAEAASDTPHSKTGVSEASESNAIRSDGQDGIATPTGRLPQHLLARATAEHAAAAKPLSDADQARFVQRVARAFQTAASQDGELRLRLSPPELGSLRLEVKVQGGVMSARIETENSATRSLLLENLPALRERLAEQNIRVEHFDVDLMNRQGGGPSNGLAQDQGGQPGSADPVARFRPAQEPIDEPAPQRPARHGVGEGQLNVLV